MHNIVALDAVPDPFASRFASQAPYAAPYEVFAPAWAVLAPYYGSNYAPWIDHLVEQHAIKLDAAADLACGSGLQARMLASRFRSVLAVDSSQAMLRVAAVELAQCNNVDFAHGSIERLALGRMFDLAVCTGDSLNYLMSEQRLGDFFASARACLHDNGLLLVDLVSIESGHMLPGQALHFVMPLRAGGELEFYQYYGHLDANNVVTDAIVTADAYEAHVRKFYSLDTIERIVADNGLRVIDLHTSCAPGNIPYRYYLAMQLA